MSPTGEVHIEQLLGRRVRDIDGAVVGRVEELCADVINGETVVTEIHLGAAALWERLGGFALHLPFVRFLPIARYEHRIPWSLVDLSDPENPRVLQPRAKLRRVRIDQD
jgi:sporulation protein YlmC with PRC-barrel domain